MIDTTYSGALTLAAGSFLLAAVLIVWRRELKATISLLAWQGVALAAIPVANGIHQGTWGPIVVGIVVLGLRGVILPLFLARAARGEGRGAREVTPLVNTTAALLVTAALTMVAYAAMRPLIEHSPTPGTRAAPATFAALLIAVFVLVSRRRAISQAIGFLMLDNAIAATAFLITAGVPLIVELGASLDILFAMVVLGVLTDRMRQSFGDTDLNQLRELRD